MRFLDLNLGEDAGLMMDKIGQLDFDLEVWSNTNDTYGRVRLQYLDALSLYVYLKEALDQ